MSPSSTQTEPIGPKYTKGEKYLFTYVLITLSLIILTCIIFLTHLWLVRHTWEQALKISRRTQLQTRTDDVAPDYQYVGMIYVDDRKRVICNTLLLSHHWSLAPAQCTSMITDPNMADYLGRWKIKYKINNEYIESDIKQTLTHSHFNRGDFENNIGLIQHSNPIMGLYYVASKPIILDEDLFQKNANNMFLVDWDVEFLEQGELSNAVANPVIPLNFTTCSSYAAPIVETLRKYEFCVTFKDHRGQNLAHGAMLVMKSEVIGFFSWGDTQAKGVPFVILNILHYKLWFENIIL